MTPITYHPMQTATVTALRAGGPDANGLPAEHAVSDGDSVPCRHCLSNVPKGAGILICAHRPFGALQPYAELGPIFLCADACTAHTGPDLPAILRTSPDYLLKGYSDDERIHYGTGKIVETSDVPSYAQALLQNPKIAFVDVRSARNNCFLLRITRQRKPS